MNTKTKLYAVQFRQKTYAENLTVTFYAIKARSKSEAIYLAKTCLDSPAEWTLNFCAASRNEK